MRDALGDPSLVFIQTVRAILLAHPVVVALAGDRIYSEPRAQRDLIFPWIRIDTVVTADAGAECQEDAVEAFVDLHVWTRTPGPQGAAQAASAVKRALHKPDPLPVIPGPWTFLDLMVDGVRHIQDRDGVTRQAIVTVRALIDPA